MAAWNDSYETDAVRLFARDRSEQRIAEASAERLASQIHAVSGQSREPAYQSHSRRLHIHVPHIIHAPHFTH